VALYVSVSLAHHNLATQLPGARQAESESERTILEAGALVAVPSTVFRLIHTKCWSTRPSRAAVVCLQG